MEHINMFIKNEFLKISECILNNPHINDVNCILSAVNSNVLTHQEIYVLPPNTPIELFINRLFEVDATLFVPDKCNINLAEYEGIKGNLIFSNLPFHQCVNVLNHIIKDRDNWKSKLEISHSTQDILEVFCQKCSALLVAPVAFLSLDYEIKSFASPAGTLHLFDKRIKADGDIICALKQSLRHHPVFTSNLNPFQIVLEMTTVVVLPILYQSQVVDYLLCFTSSNEQFQEISAYHHLFSEALCPYYAKDEKADSYKMDDLIHQLLRDLIEVKIQDDYLLDKRLKEIPLDLKAFYQCLVIKLQDTALNLEVADSMVKSICALMPHALCTLYQDHVVVLLQYDHNIGTNSHPPSLETLLEKHHAIAAFSCISDHYLHFNTLYLQCINTLRYNDRLKGKNHFRVLSYEQFRVLDIVEICSEHFKSNARQEHLFFLCDPKSIAILTYDRQHGTDLFDVMYTYLANNCNTSKTAHDLYMHRNTMICRLNKIEEIIGVKLSDEHIKFNLIFSYFIIQYITEFLEYDPLDMIHTGSIECAHGKQ